MTERTVYVLRPERFLDEIMRNGEGQLAVYHDKDSATDAIETEAFEQRPLIQSYKLRSTVHPLGAFIADHTLELLRTWDFLFDSEKTATEELAEAIVAIHHLRREKISEQEFQEEMADALIAIVHMATRTITIDEFNEIVEERVDKAHVRVVEEQNKHTRRGT